MNLIHRISIPVLFMLTVWIALTSCEELVKVGPPKTKIVSAQVFSDDEAATSSVRGIYSRMMENTSIANYDITRFTGLSSDEFENFHQSANSFEFVQNALTPVNPNLHSLWSSAYGFIYQANAILEGLANAQGVSAPVKNQLEGEAKLIRAFCHFYLVNLWGDVPIITTTDYRVNALAFRAPVAQVYQHIVADLQDASNLMTEDYVTAERARPNKYTATALLARVYLYTGDWVNAEAQATALISNSATYDLETDLNAVFLKESKETIWQILPWLTSFNTLEGSQLISMTTPEDVALKEDLLNAFDAGDNRLASWVSSVAVEDQTFYFPFKYKIKSGTDPIEYYVVLRLAEQYLIRAEARVQQDKLDDALADLDAIRLRAGLPPVRDTNPSIDKTGILSAIEQERRIELFSEWGHRWFDLKRTNRADAILGPLKSAWQTTDVLYPVPQSEMNSDPNLRPQNDGY